MGDAGRSRNGFVKSAAVLTTSEEVCIKVRMQLLSALSQQSCLANSVHVIEIPSTREHIQGRIYLIYRTQQSYRSYNLLWLSCRRILTQ